MENVLDNVIDSELTGNDPGTVETSDGKTFSQEEVNSIIRDRLAKEKEKTQKQHEAIAKEYQAKELNLKARELLTEKGLSADILEVLKYDDEDSLIKSVAIVEKTFKDNKPILSGIRPASRYESIAGGEPNPDDKIREAFNLKK